MEFLETYVTGVWLEGTILFLVRSPQLLKGDRPHVATLKDMSGHVNPQLHRTHLKAFQKYFLKGATSRDRIFDYEVLIGYCNFNVPRVTAGNLYRVLICVCKL